MLTIFCVLSGRVDCSSDIMNIVINRNYLNSLGYDSHSLYLNDSSCRPRISSYQVVFRFPVYSCGNVKEVDNSSLFEKNPKHTAVCLLSVTALKYPWTVSEWQGCIHQHSTCLRQHHWRDHTPVTLEAVHGLLHGSGFSVTHYVPCPTTWQQQHCGLRQIQHHHEFLHVQQLLLQGAVVKGVYRISNSVL